MKITDEILIKSDFTPLEWGFMDTITDQSLSWYYRTKFLARFKYCVRPLVYMTMVTSLVIEFGGWDIRQL